MTTEAELQAQLDEAQEELLKAQQWFDVLELAEFMIGAANNEGYFIFLNDLWSVKLGYTKEKLYNTPYIEFVHPDDIEATYAEATKIAEGAKIISFTNRYLTKNGEYIWMFWYAVPHGDLIYFVAQDITERKEREKERERLQQELIAAQQQALRELSVPIIPVMEGIIVMPLIGSIDTMRARAITRALLGGITQYQAKAVIIDVTGVPLIDSGIADHLNKTVQAARLKGTRTIITGISDSVAETVVDLGINWSEIDTLRDLQTGLRTAIQQLGLSFEET